MEEEAMKKSSARISLVLTAVAGVICAVAAWGDVTSSPAGTTAARDTQQRPVLRAHHHPPTRTVGDMFPKIL
jgi:hypothetical protein